MSTKNYRENKPANAAPPPTPVVCMLCVKLNNVVGVGEGLLNMEFSNEVSSCLNVLFHDLIRTNLLMLQVVIVIG